MDILNETTKRLALTALLTVAALRPAAGVVSCGSNVTTDDVMTSDLVCPDDPAVTVTSATLDMAGFNITSTGGKGVLLMGEGSKLLNGRVSNCDIGVFLSGTGKHKVSNVLVTGSFDTGFAVASNKNKLGDTIAIGNDVGYDLVGIGNSLVRSHATNNNDGFRMSGNGHKLTDSTAYGGNRSFIVNASGSTASKNAASTCNSTCFGVAGTDDKIVGNVVAGGDVGFRISGTAGDKVAKNTVIGSFSAGFNVSGSGATFLQNVSNAVENDDGFHVTGNDNTFKQCAAIYSSGDGFDIAGLRNTLSASRVTESLLDGIRMQGQDGTITGCTAIGSVIGVDLHDTNASCDNNTWADNIFATEADPGNCIQ